MTKIPSVEQRVAEISMYHHELLKGKLSPLFLDKKYAETLTAEREAGAREERERIKKEITEQTLLNNDDDTFVKLSEALWVCDSKEDRDRFIQALTPPTK